MILRQATAADVPQIGQLFYDTISQVNSRDYTPAQVEAWRAGWLNTASWLAKLDAQYFLVAGEADGSLAGFGYLCPTSGLLDFLFVSARHQRQGVAQELLKTLLNRAVSLGLSVVHTNASVTAQPFFERQGFVVERAQQIVVRGVELSNYRMVKHLAVPSLHTHS